MIMCSLARMNEMEKQKEQTVIESSQTLVITPTSVALGFLLAMIAGFLDAYTYVTRNGVFANAQTGNVVLLAVKIAEGQWYQASLHVPPIITYIVGVAVAEQLKHPKKPRNTARLVLFLEGIILFVIGTFPTQIPNIVITSIISFVASVQVAFFDKLDKWSYNNTVVSGNLRTASQAAYLAMFTHDQKEKVRFRRFLTIVVAFVVGAILGAMSSHHLGVISIWIAASLMFCAVLLFQLDRNSLNRTDSI